MFCIFHHLFNESLNDLMKKFLLEILEKQTTTILQILCKSMLYSEVIVKSIIVPDDVSFGSQRHLETRRSTTFTSTKTYLTIVRAVTKISRKIGFELSY